MSTWVLLRGLTRQAGHWGDFADRFAEVEPGARVIALDLPGAGTLHERQSPASVEGIVQHCRAQLADIAHSEPLRLFGLSLGGMVAAQWALLHPQQVSHCVVLNTSMRPLGRLHERLRPARWPMLLKLLLERDDFEAERGILELTSAMPARHAARLAHWMALRGHQPVRAANALRQLLAAARYRLPLQPLRMPALVLCGARDALVDPVCSRRLASHWHCDFAQCAEAGHDLPLDAPQWVIERVRDWLRSTPCALSA